MKAFATLKKWISITTQEHCLDVDLINHWQMAELSTWFITAGIYPVSASNPKTFKTLGSMNDYIETRGQFAFMSDEDVQQAKGIVEQFEAEMNYRINLAKTWPAPNALDVTNPYQQIMGYNLKEIKLDGKTIPSTKSYNISEGWVVAEILDKEVRLTGTVEVEFDWVKAAVECNDIVLDYMIAHGIPFKDSSS